MAIVLDLKPDMEAAAQAQARTRGISVAEYLQTVFASSLTAPARSEREDEPAQGSPEWVALIRRIGISAGVSLSDEAASRESLYEDHL